MGLPPVTLKVRLLFGMLAGLLLGVLSGLAGASDDWDWDAVEEMDEGPVTKAPVVTGSAPTTGAVERTIRLLIITPRPQSQSPRPPGSTRVVK